MDAAYVIDASGEGDGPTGVRVPWWSFTKTLLAIAIFRAAEDGLVGLDEPVGPGAFSLRQLLRHTAGLPDYGDWPDYHHAVAAGGEPWPSSAVIERGIASASPPGDWAYSNIGYAIAGALLTQATGRGLGELLSLYVFGPAGAVSARLAETPGDLAEVRGITRGYHPAWVYHGLVIGELRDAARVIRALQGGDLVSSPSLQGMLDLTDLPQFRTALWHEPSYGAGVMAPRLANGQRLVGHTGGGPTSAIAVYAAETRAGVAAAAVFSDSGGDVEQRVSALLGVPADLR
ncbi:serine hydrolase [Phenylobacterium sp.]|uniref:serine hydrolase domain-containing protein n=1 Tax=Phenylobacterium sp. TaxID=1871053 RepID=UPI0027377B11|nr:serine hydrolase domain-containing protein [Phenylobacterium sp.]MDP3635157.1 serine hydrolase domain-containing protein [Phenylobacterium sp.]